MSPREAETGSGSRRARLALLLLIVFGAPVCVSLSLLRQDIVGEVTRGSQPGGTLEGEVRDASGEPLATEEVALWHALGPTDRRHLVTTVTGAQGEFTLTAPPVEGSYELRAGGGTRRKVVRGVSFLHPNGKTIQPKPIRLELKPGAILELTFTRSDGTPVEGGRYTLDGEFGEGPFLGLVPYSLRNTGRIEDGKVRLDGIPPMKAELSVVLATGESVALTLDIEPGLNQRDIEL